MAIYAPAKRINPTLNRKGGMGKKQVFAGLLLTSMIDVFALMTIFLLNSFSAEGELVVLPQGFELPKAENVGTLDRAPSLIISLDQITFEGKQVGVTAQLAAQEDWSLPALQDELKTYRDHIRAEWLHYHPGDDAGAEATATDQKQKVNISADRRLEFAVIRKVIYNAGRMGYPNFRFAVFAGGTAAVNPNAVPAK